MKAINRYDKEHVEVFLCACNSRFVRPERKAIQFHKGSLAMENYWIVGATWSGDDKRTLARRRDKIKEGNRIAIKTMNGRGQATITIHAIGIVKGNDSGKIYINWILTDFKRRVASKGCYGTIHGPYKYSDPWIKEVFCI